MSMMQGPGPSGAQTRESRGLFVTLGVVLVVLGLGSMIAAAAATLATVLLFGILMLSAGGAQVVHAFSTAHGRGFLPHLLGGTLYLVIGALIVIDPVGGMIGLTLLLAAFFVAAGVVKIAMGVQSESGWFALVGVVDLLLGLLIAIGWPETGTWVIGLFVGIELFLAGVSLILVTSAGRDREQLSL
jgi:uncharacterized membrane protein HdeD (DUF308 family)